jgi:hypothetical protein
VRPRDVEPARDTRRSQPTVDRTSAAPGVLELAGIAVGSFLATFGVGWILLRYVF